MSKTKVENLTGLAVLSSTGRGDYGSDFSLNEIAVVAREANGEYN